MVPQPLLRSWRASRSSVVVLAALAGAALAAGSCNKMPLVAPSGTAITLVAATNVLPVNGSVDVTAVLIEGGQNGGQAGGTTAGVGTPVHNGTLVTFTTTLGKIEPAEARTDAGKATVKLVADGRSGKATITAFSGAATKTLDVNIGAAGASRIAVTANPQSLAAAGGSTQISARVEDAQGNGLQGVPVSFSTTAGTLDNTTVISNEQGFSNTTLTTAQEAVVTASAGGATAALSGTVTVKIKPRVAIEIGAPASGAQIGVAAPFTFTPSTGAFITDAVVNWGDGTSTNLGALSAPRAVSHLFEDTGNLTVSVHATGSETSSTDVFVAPLGLSITPNPASVTAPNSITFTANITPAAAAIDHVSWDFGDGGVADGPVVSHLYVLGGAKTVRATAVPVRGPSKSTTTTVDIK